MLELARRGVLGACLLIGLWLFFLPDQSPLWTVGPTVTGHNITGQDTAGRVMPVSGPLWEAFFRQADQALAGGRAEKAFARRLGQGPRQDGSIGPKLYYKYYDPPLADLGRPEKAVLRLEGSDQALALDVFVPSPQSAPWKDRPPTALTHPWRKTGWKAWPAGLLTALFLPWPAIGGAVLRWPRRRILALDVAWLGLTGLCFGLPLAFFHGMAFSNAARAGFTALCWGGAALGLCLGFITAVRAGSGVRLTAQGMMIIGLGEDVFVPYGLLASARALARTGWSGTLGWFTPWTVVLSMQEGKTLVVRLGDQAQVRRLLEACDGATTGDRPGATSGADPV